MSAPAVAVRVAASRISPIVVALSLVALAPGAYSQGAQLEESQSTGFRIFDATLYKNKPKLSRQGVEPIHIAYEPHVFATSDRSARPEDAMPSEMLLRRQAQLARSKGKIFVIDIEAWSVYRSSKYPQQVARNIARYEAVLQQARHIAPDLKVGLFGPLPLHSGYERLIAREGSDLYLDMVRDNDNLVALAQAVDAIFPIGYTMTTDRREWRLAVSRQIDESRRLNAGVPIYVFIWPQYANYGAVPKELRSRWIEPEYWRYQLDALEALADGVVIWGGWDDTRNAPSDWDDHALWWQETVRFIEKHRAAAR
jgi:hypothetical protein